MVEPFQTHRHPSMQTNAIPKLQRVMSLIYVSVSGGPGAVAQPYNREPQYSAAPQLVLSFLLNKKRLFTLVVILSNQKIKVYYSLPRLLARLGALAIPLPDSTIRTRLDQLNRDKICLFHIANLS